MDAVRGLTRRKMGRAGMEESLFDSDQLHFVQDC